VVEGEDLTVAAGQHRSGMQMASRGYRFRQFLAWCVHAYTALGLVAAAGIAVLIVAGGHESFRWALVLMLVATLIDATDGVLARAVRTKEVLPGFDGRRLDDLVDYLTYAALPLLLVWRAQIVSAGPAAWFLLVPLAASAYGFCQVAAKTDDGYFCGFPSYWNVVAFYLYVLHRYVVPLPGWFSIGVLLGFSLLTFVPTRYVYASQGGRLNRLTIMLAGVWAGLVVWILYRWPPPAPASVSDGDLFRGLILVSLLFPVYYMAASWAVSWRLWRRRRSRPRELSGVPHE